MAISGKVAGSVGGVGVAGAITIISTWLVKLKWNLDIPDSVGDAITMLLTALGAGIGGWLIPHREIVTVNGNGALPPAEPAEPGPVPPVPGAH